MGCLERFLLNPSKSKENGVSCHNPFFKTKLSSVYGLSGKMSIVERIRGL